MADWTVSGLLKILCNFTKVVYFYKKYFTLESGIDVGQGINVGTGKSGKINKRRALNTHVLCSE